MTEFQIKQNQYSSSSWLISDIIPGPKKFTSPCDWEPDLDLSGKNKPVNTIDILTFLRVKICYYLINTLIVYPLFVFSIKC